VCIVGTKSYFLTVDQGSLSISCEGPSEPKFSYENKSGTLHIAYEVSVEGSYYMAVQYRRSHVPGSPFRINVS